MRPCISKNILIWQLVLLMVSMIAIPGCWIPLPEETAIVVEVFDAQGNPVDGVSLLLDSADTIVTGSQLDVGQIFISLSQEGDHTLQLDTASLVDPQGGIGWMPLAYQISGDVSALAFTNKPFVGSSEVLIVPVNKGEVTVATFYLDDIQKSPMDNQWLTDGSNTSPYRLGNNTDEFRDSPEPVFWWKTDPSLGDTVVYTFQLWEDDDGDTRFPLGVINHAQYNTAMDPAGLGYKQPDWQVPLAGIQRVESASTVNQVQVWSSPAFDGPDTIRYDLYYAPTTLWNNAVWENNPVARNINDTGVLDGFAMKFVVGAGSANPGLVLTNGTEYTFALRARDAVSNLDSITGITSTRMVTLQAGTALGAITNLGAVADSLAGGSLDLTFICNPFDDLRVYVAPSADFSLHPYDIRFIRDTLNCNTSPKFYSLTGLVNGIEYAVALEPFDSSGNVGTASSVVLGTPSGASSGDTAAPTGLSFTAIPMGSGNVDVTVSAVTDASSVIRRIYWAPAIFTPNEEAMMFTTYVGGASPQTLSISDIPNGIPFNYAVRAIDSSGNSSFATTQFALSEISSIGPTWASDDPAFFSTVSYSMGGTIWPLGVTWDYGSSTAGFALGQDPQTGAGEYVWRVIQENPVKGVSRATKLGVFYTYSGYYYASTESGGLAMSSPSTNADHRDVFSFAEAGILSADVMGTPFDSTDSARYRQRTAAQYSASLAAGFDTSNQLSILYNTDEDGQAVAFPATLEISPGNFIPGDVGILRVIAQNKQGTFPTPEPHLQVKNFQTSYFTGTDDLEIFPPPFVGVSGIYYIPPLDEADYQDPLW
jgi:hypothetical protein